MNYLDNINSHYHLNSAEKFFSLYFEVYILKIQGIQTIVKFRVTKSLWKDKDGFDVYTYLYFLFVQNGSARIPARGSHSLAPFPWSVTLLGQDRDQRCLLQTDCVWGVCVGVRARGTCAAVTRVGKALWGLLVRRFPEQSIQIRAGPQRWDSDLSQSVCHTIRSGTWSLCVTPRRDSEVGVRGPESTASGQLASLEVQHSTQPGRLQSSQAHSLPFERFQFSAFLKVKFRSYVHRTFFNLCT